MLIAGVDDEADVGVGIERIHVCKGPNVVVWITHSDKLGCRAVGSEELSERGDS